MTDNEALELLLKYNTQPFHIKHALTVSEVMRYFAQALGYADQADFWAQEGCCTISTMSCGRRSTA